VTNTVQVSSASAVTRAVSELFAAQWPGAPLEPISASLATIDALFTGRVPGYNGIDTIYHDRQHTLDVALAMARLLVGYERGVPIEQRLGPERATMGLVTAVFHDSGYIRETADPLKNGAEYTSSHVTRSARFLSRHLPTIGMGHWVPVATRIVHFTGYEIPLSSIEVGDWRDRKVGHLLGTADLVAQMADRCYLEKCRDRLYPEFVLGGIAATTGVDGSLRVRYSSGLDLLRQTPEFVRETFVARLEGEFEHAYRYVECLFGGKNPYLEAIERNLGYLHRVLRTERWPMLRRSR